MKGILEFELPEDQEEFNYAIKACELHSALASISESLRVLLKHSDDINDRVRMQLSSIRQEALDVL